MNSVSKKLLWGIGLPALGLTLLGLGLAWREAQQAIVRAQEENAEAVSAWVQSALASSPGDLSEGALAENLALFRSVHALRVLDLKGRVLFSNAREEIGTVHPDARRLLSSRPQAEAGVEFITRLEGPACPSCPEGTSPHVLHLRLAPPPTEATFQTLFYRILVGALVFWVLLGVATALALQWAVTRPLQRLAGLMRRAESGDFLVRAPTHRDDEMGGLAQAFNRMLAAITSLKADGLETHRYLEEAHAKLSLQAALEKSHAELKNRLTELSTLYEVAGHLSSTLSLQELLDRITHLVPDRLSIPQFSIMLLNKAAQLEVRSAFPSLVGQAEITFQLGEGVCGTAATTRTACYVANAEEDQTHYRVHPGTPRSKGSLLSVPMLHGQELLGVLNFERPEKHAFTPENIRFLTAVADQAALAVKNAQLHEETVELSLTDALTQVSNRRHLFARLETEVARANRFGTQLAVLMIDIDHFKKLNDAAGHRAGDDALRAVSALLRNSLRKVDIIARYGGEEFMVVLPEISKAEAVEVAEKLRQSVEQTPLEYARFQPSGILSISVGVSHLPSDATVQETLIDCADASLYASKRGGRNKVSAFAPGMEAHPGRERGPLAAKRARTTELPAARPQSNS